VASCKVASCKMASCMGILFMLTSLLQTLFLLNLSHGIIFIFILVFVSMIKVEERLLFAVFRPLKLANR
jgi:hypothetical protein